MVGGVWGTWLHVVGMWVDEAFRGRGYGRGLLLAAEAEAREAGARHAFLETHTFQVPGLYQRPATSSSPSSRTIRLATAS